MRNNIAGRITRKKHRPLYSNFWTSIVQCVIFFLVYSKIVIWRYFYEHFLIDPTIYFVRVINLEVFFIGRTNVAMLLSNFSSVLFHNSSWRDLLRNIVSKLFSCIMEIRDLTTIVNIANDQPDTIASNLTPYMMAIIGSVVYGRKWSTINYC